MWAGFCCRLGATEWLAKTWKDLPTAQSIHLDGAVIAFACALMFAAALIAGLLPALSTTGKSMLKALQTSVADRLEQRFAHRAQKVAAHGGDWNHRGAAGGRRAAAQKFYAIARSRCRAA